MITSAHPLGIIRFAGDDAQAFLQGQSTPDIRQLTHDACVLGAFCSAQGRIIANGWLHRYGEGFQLIMPRDGVKPLTDRLKRYVMRSKVTITDASESIALWLLADPLTPPETSWLQGIQSSDHDEWSLPLCPGLTLIASNAPIDENIQPLAGNAFNLALIKAGIPLISAETTDSFIPQMIGLELWGGLSFDKGCYTGQEIVTRTQFLGSVKRSLYRLSSDTISLPPAGSVVFGASEAEEPIGTVLLSAPVPGGGSVGLAVLKNPADQSSAFWLHNQRIRAEAFERP
jgi:tRNA-modifying protein YgfZ